MSGLRFLMKSKWLDPKCVEQFMQGGQMTMLHMLDKLHLQARPSHSTNTI